MKVVVIDDEPLVRRSLQRALQAAGHQVWLAENGQQGLQVWQEVTPDLIFLDVLMPELTGPQVLQTVAADLRGRTKVILMSAYTGNADFRGQMASSADLFIAKPFEDVFNIVKIAEDMVKA